MPIDYRIALGLLAVAVLWYYFTNRWCWNCKRFSATTGWWAASVQQVDQAVESGKGYFFVLKERRKECNDCCTTQVVDATSSLVDEYTASQYRDDINRQVQAAKE